MSDCRTQPNLVVKHIVDNFFMFGFGSEESALLQCVKELVENSIDASRVGQIGATKGRVRVCIAVSSTVDPPQQLLTIEVEDEGSGMRDPQDMLRCFTTDKTTSAGGGAGAVTMTGRFGVGLSTCFLYSLERTRVPMRVMTKHRDAQMAVIADFDLDAQLNPTVVQSGRIAVGVPSGTTIRIHLPINPSTRIQTLNRVIPMVHTYLVRSDLLPSSLCDIDFNVQVNLSGVDELSFRSSHRECDCGGLPELVVAMNGPTTDSSMTLRAPLDRRMEAAVFKSRYNNYHLGSGVQCVESVLQHSTKSVSASSQFECVVYMALTRRDASAGVTSGQAHAQDETTDGGGDGPTGQQQPLEQSRVIPLQVWRYVNHVSLVDYGDDALSCSITAAIRAVDWATYGYRLQLSLCAAPPHCEAQQQQQQQGYSSSPRWELHCTRPDPCELLQSDLHGVVLLVDLIGPIVPFANMRKTSLSHEDRGSMEAIQDGVYQTLRAIHAEPGRLKDLFLTSRQYKELRMSSKYAPSLVSSVCKLYAACQSADLDQWMTGCLPDDHTSHSCAMNQRLKSFLEAKLLRGSRATPAAEYS